MKYYASTSIGKKRNKNEDYYFAGMLTIPKLEKQIGLFIVADGMGGYSGGDIASKLAVNTVTNTINLNIDTICENVSGVIKEAIVNANIEIKKLADNDKTYINMGTTIAVVLIVDNIAYHSEIGDTRIYHLSGDNLTQVSKDDTFVGKLVEDGVITKEESIYHPQRHVLTMALGIYNDINIKIDSFNIRKNDKILLCSDGLTNMVNDEKIKEKLKLSNDEDISNELLTIANENGGDDNITAIVILD